MKLISINSYRAKKNPINSDKLAVNHVGKFIILFLIFLLGTVEALAVCSNPYGKAGARKFFAADNKYKYCNNTNWVSMQLGGITQAGSITGTSFSNFSGAKNAVVSGTYAYIAGGNQFSIVDLTNTQEPRILKTIFNSNFGDYLAVYGNYVYVNGRNANSNRIYPIDVTNKNSPSVLTSISNAALDSALDMKINGSYLYLVSNYRLAIVNLATPSAPVYSGSTAQDFSKFNGSVAKIGFSGNHVIVSSDFYNGITIVDATNKAAPSVSGNVSNFSNIPSPTDLVINGNYAYLACSSNKVSVVSIANKASPVYVNSLTDSFSLDGVLSLAIKGNYLFTSGTGNWGVTMSTLDITAPTSPVVFANNNQGYLMDLKGLSLDGDTMIGLSDLGTALYVFDVSPKLAVAAEKNFFARGSPLKIVDLAVSGTIAVGVSEDEKLFVFDVTTPSTFVNRGQAIMPPGSGTAGSKAVAFDGTYAYVAETSNNRIIIVDVGSNPDNPVVVGVSPSNNFLSDVEDIATDGNYVYVANSSGLIIVDATNKTAPAYLTRTGTSFKGVKVVGNYVYVTSLFSNNFRIYNVTTKSTPSLSGQFTNPTHLVSPKGLEIVGNYAYVLSQDRLVVVNITTPTSPFIQSYLVNSTNLSTGDEVVIIGNMAFVLSTGRLVSLNISGAASPTLAGNLTGLDSTSTYSGLIAASSAVFTGTNTGFRAYSAVSSPVLLKASSGIIGANGGISASGNNVFLTTNNSVVSFDISSPASPTVASVLVDNTQLASVKRNVVSGTRLFAVGNNYITAVDISNPASPTISGHLNDAVNLPVANTIRIVGNYAYIGGNKISVVDISGVNPVFVSSLTDAKINNCEDMAQAGNYLYLTCEGSYSFLIVSIANPVAPVIIGSFTDTYYMWKFEHSMTVVNNVAYIAYKANLTTLAIDVSNPAAPKLLNNLYGWCSMLAPGAAANQITCLEDGKFYSLDVSNRYEETSVGYANVTGDTGNNSYQEAVVSGNYIYSFVASSGIQVTSLVSNNVPSLRTRFGGALPLQYAVGLDIVGNYAYVSTGNSYLEIYDVSNIASATLISSTFISDLYTGYSYPWGVAVSGTYAYMAGFDERGTVIVDVSDITKPKRIGKMTAQELTGQEFIKVFGTYAYGTGNNSGAGGGFAIFNVTNPTAPIKSAVLADSIELNSPRGFDLSADENYAYVCSAGNGKLTAVNVSSKNSIYVQSSYLDLPKLGGCNDVIVDGNYAYITGTTSGSFNVINISNPNSMSLTASISSTASFGGGYEGQDIAMSGTTVVVTNNNFVTTVDVSVPSSPTIIDTYPTGGNTQEFVAFKEDKFFVANPYANMLRVYNLATPTKMGTCTKAGQLEYDVSQNTYKFCNGAFFYATTVPGLGGAGCSSPSGKAGTLDYHTGTNKLRYCDGNSWVQIGP